MVTALVVVCAVMAPAGAGAAAGASIRIHQQDTAGAAVLGGCWRATGTSTVVDRCDIDDGSTDGVIQLDGVPAGEHQLHQSVGPVGHRAAADRVVNVDAGQVRDVTTTHPPFPTLRATTTASGETIGGSCWVLRLADQTEGGIDFCDDDDGTTDGSASAKVDTTGEHVLFHTRGPSGYVLLDPTPVSIADADVALSLELQTPPPPAAPANVVAPTVTGTARVGIRLTTDPGTWTGDPSISYQWQRCTDGPGSCTDLPGQTSPNYLTQLDDADRFVRAVVTATNPQGSTSAATAPTAPIDDAPVAGSLPSVTGRALVGTTLSATSGAWLSYYGTPTISLEWQRCDATACRSIGDQSSTHTLTDADLGFRMRVVVTASDRGGSSTASSLMTGTVVAAGPRAVYQPSVSGTPYLGEVWTSTPGTWSGDGRITVTAHQWERCSSSCVPIPGATSRTYRTTKADGGRRLRIVVTVADATGSASATSEESATIEVRTPTVVSPPTLSGSAGVGGKLTLDRGAWFSPIGNISYRYNWMRCSDPVPVRCDLIDGANGSSYTVTRADVGSWLRVRVDATNRDGTTSAVTPLTTQVTLRPPTVVSPPTLSGSAGVGGKLTLDRGAWFSPIGNISYRYNWMRCSDPVPVRCDLIDGANGSSYTVTRADVGSWLRVRVDATNRDGTTSAVTPLTTQVTRPSP